MGVSDVGPQAHDPIRQLVVPELPALPDVDSLKAITGSVTCRLVDHEAVLQCKRCGNETRVSATPRRDLLAAVRGFVADHEECHG